MRHFCLEFQSVEAPSYASYTQFGDTYVKGTGFESERAPHVCIPKNDVRHVVLGAAQRNYWERRLTVEMKVVVRTVRQTGAEGI